MPYTGGTCAIMHTQEKFASWKPFIALPWVLIGSCMYLVYIKVKMHTVNRFWNQTELDIQFAPIMVDQCCCLSVLLHYSLRSATLIYSLRSATLKPSCERICLLRDCQKLCAIALFLCYMKLVLHVCASLQSALCCLVYRSQRANSEAKTGSAPYWYTDLTQEALEFFTMTITMTCMEVRCIHMIVQCLSSVSHDFHYLKPIFVTETYETWECHCDLA